MASLDDIIREAAARYGVDPATLRRVAEIESRMNPAAQNPKSSAGGLFQFIDSTWADYGRGGNRMDPALSADAAARLTADNMGAFRKAFGRDPTGGEAYLMHQQGAGGALKLLQNPGASAESLVGGDAVRLNGGRPGMTAQEFANLWTEKFGGPSLLKGEGQKTAMTGANPAMPGSETGMAMPLGDILASMQPKQQVIPPMAAPQQAPQRRRPNMAKVFEGLNPVQLGQAV